MAQVLAADEEITRVSFADIQKWEEGPDGTLFVYGRATTPDVDTDEQVVASSWSGSALKQWLQEAPALRVQHNPSRDPAGSGVKVEVDRDGDGAHWVKAAVDEPIAQRLVKRGHLRAFSIGIARPVIERDATGKARGGIIKGGKIVEVSLVDSPANRSCFLELAKADKSGTPEFTGKVFGADDLLTKAAPAVLVVDDRPGHGAPPPGSPFSPSDFAKLKTLKQQLALGRYEVQSAKFAAEAAVYKRDIDTATRRRLAGQGRALADGSYPIETHEDADNAATLALSGHGNVSGAKKLIRRIARKEGWQDILDRLGGKKKEKSVDTAPEAMAVKDDGPDDQPESMPEAAPPEAVKADGGDPHEPVLHHDDGEDDDTDSDADANEKAVEPEAAKAMPPAGKPKVPCPKCKAPCKAKAKFCGKCGCPMTAEKADKPTPGDGVTGAAAAAVEPVPPHREPDGSAFEAFEHDASLPTVPDSSVKTAARMRELGVSNQEGMLHDLLCPAYPGASVKAAWPGADLSQVDEQGWQAKAFEASTSAPLGEFQQAAEKASQVWTAARILKSVPADLYEEVMADAHKAFRDANPGPAKAPQPGEMHAERYNRPYISAGHSAPSPGHDGPNTSPIHPEHISAADFSRGLITGGHAADSPSNDSARPTPIPAPEVPGVPSRVFYTNTQRQNAAQAMRQMHDHIAQTFPDLCPMHGPGRMGEPPSHARPVAAGVAGPVPHGASKAADAVEAVTDEATARAAKKAAKRERRQRELIDAIVKQVQDGLITDGEIRGAGGAVKAAVPGPPAPLAPAVAATADPDLIKAALAPVLDELAEQKRMLHAIADQPDPAVTAYRGAAIAKASAPPAGALSSPVNAEHAQAATYRVMYDQWQNHPDPELRNQAWTYLLGATGLMPKPPA